MIIKNAQIYMTDHQFHKGDLHIADGRITRVCCGSEAGSHNDSACIDAAGCYVIPGLIDIHFHGCMGQDFCDGTEEAVQTLAEYEAAHGITAICPATLTLPVEQLCRVLQTGAQFAREQKTRAVASRDCGEASMQADCADQKADSRIQSKRPVQADFVGINMEGPFISHVKKGAQNEAYIIGCDPAVCEEFLRAGDGLVKIVGLAPEENPEYLSYIQAVKDKVRISLAHTNAGYDTAKAAFDAGASHAVHLYNAMPELTHREPGVVGAVMDSPHVTAELICDGNHVHPAAVRAAFRMIGADRIVLISDSLRATGLGDGIIDLGGQRVKVEGTRATLVDGGNLAGSVTNLMDCMRIAVREMGISLEDAVRCATINPARVIGADADRGSLEVGKLGDVVLLKQDDLSVRCVIKEGRVI